MGIFGAECSDDEHPSVLCLTSEDGVDPTAQN